MSEQGGRKKPLSLVMCAAVLLVFAIIFALGQVTAHGDGQPRATATPDPRPLQYGDVQVCHFSQYNASTMRCLSNNDTIDIAGQRADQIVWLVRRRGSAVATIQVLQQDGTGRWRVTGSSVPNALAAHSADGKLQSETVQTLFADAGVVALCNARYLIRVVDSDYHQLGQVPVSASC